MEGSAASKPVKRMVIVGNGPLSVDLAPLIDEADFVLRFNQPKFPVGSRTDCLFLTNANKPMQFWLGSDDFLASPVFRRAREIVLPYHPAIIRRYFPKPNPLSLLKGRRADWTLAAIESFGAAGKDVRVLSTRFYDEGCDALSLPQAQRRTVFPSTGFFGIRFALEHFAVDAWRIELCGFTWEGWKRHAWADERRWVSERIGEGRLTVLEP